MGVLHAVDPTVAPPLAILRTAPLVSRSSASAIPSPDPPPDPLLGRSRYCLCLRRLPTQSVLVIRAVAGCYGDVPAFPMLLVPLCSNSAVLPWPSHYLFPLSFRFSFLFYYHVIS